MSVTIGKCCAEAVADGLSLRKCMIGKGLVAIREIAAATGEDSNKLARAYLNADIDAIVETSSSLLVDEAIKQIWQTINKTDKGFNKKCVISVENRPRKDRPIGSCYANALREYRATGNPVVIGWVCCPLGTLAHFTPHAFNYDKKKKTYYDTDHPLRSDTIGTRMVLLALDEHKTKKWYENPTNLEKTVGVFWICLISEERVAYIHCEAEKPRSDDYTETTIGVSVINLEVAGG